MTKQLKEIEIPFGAKDSELCGWEYTIPGGMEATIVDNKIIVKKKESEDEKIRKAIHIYLDWLDGRNKDYHPKGIYTIRDMIAWLEKQGKQKPQRIVSAEAKEVMYDKPAWSEEDEQTFNKSVEALEKLGKEITKDKETATKFLKSAGIMDENGELAEPYRVCESTSNWSEEDEKIVNKIINATKEYQQLFNFGKIAICINTDKFISWLKDLKERYTWKPSGAQIASLTIACDRNDRIGFDLTQLLKELKKLKE